MYIILLTCGLFHIVLVSCCVYNEFVMTRPCDHRPSVSRGMIASSNLVKKNEIFLAFQILFEQTSNTGERVLQ